MTEHTYSALGVQAENESARLFQIWQTHSSKVVGNLPYAEGVAFADKVNDVNQRWSELTFTEMCQLLDELAELQVRLNMTRLRY